MKILRIKIWLVLFALLVASVSCGLLESDNSQEDALPTPAPTLADPADSFLEKVGEDIGVKIDKDGHLLVQGYPDVRVLRLITYLNAEARTRGKNRKSYPYKLAGLYGSATDSDGYNDHVDYRMHISFDDFEPPVDLFQLAKELGVSISPRGYLVLENEDPYENLDALLTYRNAEAANSGDYKLKAWYDRKELGDEFLFDRVDIMVQFSFEQPFRQKSTDLKVSIRSISAAEQRQNDIIANTAVEFSQLLKNPEILTIVTLDFAGDREHGPERAYVFDKKAVERLQAIYQGKEGGDFSKGDILALAEVKDRLGQARTSANDSPREKEPIGEKAIEIVAYIAVETAMALNPSGGLSITIYDFIGNAPKKLTTWVYLFDGEATEVIRTGDLTPQEVLREASVSEYAGVLPGNRFIPPVKPVPSEFTPIRDE